MGSGGSHQNPPLLSLGGQVAEPQTYESANEFISALNISKRGVAPPDVIARPREESELFFFLDPGIRDLEGTLRTWKLMPEELRVVTIKTLAGSKLGEDPHPLLAEQEIQIRRKAMLWIIYQESLEGGSHAIARAAFRIMMGE